MRRKPLPREVLLRGTLEIQQLSKDSAYIHTYSHVRIKMREEKRSGVLCPFRGGSTLTRATNNNNNIKNKLKGEKSRKASSET